VRDSKSVAARWFSADLARYSDDLAEERHLDLWRPVRRLAERTAVVVGSQWAFAGACAATFMWFVWGVAVGFSDRWLLVPSAVASVVTLLIAFGLQYSQNRDTRAIQLKLDEILRTSEAARSEFIKLERLDDRRLAEIEADVESAQPGADRRARNLK
jgi:low affinity Fe/Cu permease